MSFRVTNEFFIRALLCFVRVGYTRTMGIQRKPLTADHQTGGGGAQLTTLGPDCYHIDKTTNYYNTTLEYWSGEEMKIYFFLGERFGFGFVVLHDFL